MADCNGHMGCHSQPHSSNLIIKNIFWLAIKTRRWWRHAKLEDMGEMITSRTERTWRWRCHQVGERSRCSRLYDGRATCIANDTEPRRIIQLSTRGPGQSAALTLPPPSCMRGAGRPGRRRRRGVQHKCVLWETLRRFTPDLRRRRFLSHVGPSPLVARFTGHAVPGQSRPIDWAIKPPPPCVFQGSSDRFARCRT